LFSLIFSSGACSDIVNSSERLSAATRPTNNARRGGHWTCENKNDLSYHIYGLEGTIVETRATSAKLESIAVKVAQSLDTAVGYQPYEANSGEVAIIHFDECLKHFGNLKFADGDVVLIYFGQINDDSQDSQNWGSNSHWIAVGQRGSFYDSNGKKVAKEHPFPAQ